ncbi:cysteine proteinase [Patellaria atrata CBS 101060]|uniref:Cysteine proteinase n=1 Tax=Patellaria atrata CBS 101060 TaxID=1346257 RepID=A0A9P4SG39_9PEZI|nr:cysteine proteinase [Patellaria atrata CBS 101060]
MEELQARHRKEQRDLQARITQKKKSATKKTRKGVNDECATLETELKERHTRELLELTNFDGNRPNEQVSEDEVAEDINGDATEALTAIPSYPTPNGENSQIDTPSLSSGRSIDSPPPEPQARKKPNRQKARLARRAAEQKAAAVLAAEEAANLPNQKELERKRMNKQLEERALQEKEVRADGHCLYSAFADQLDCLGLGLSPADQPSIRPKLERAGDLPNKSEAYKTIREAAADYIESNPDDFVPFLEEPLQDYVRKIKQTGEWGGQLELLALARTYGVKIHVLHGDGNVVVIAPDGDKNEDKDIWLGYYRHGFGLGEHYNSLRKKI